MAVSDANAPTANPAVHEALEQLRAVRDEAFAELGRLSEPELRYSGTWGGMQRNVNFLLRAFALHGLDHLQHAQRLLRARGVQPSEAQLILMEVQAVYGKLEGLLMTLSDEEFEATGPNEGDWSMRQLVDHVRETDARYLQNTRAAVGEGRAAS